MIMMRNLYGKTLYQKRFMALGWFLGVTAMTMFTLAFFNSFSDGALGTSLQGLPPALQKVVGDSLSFTTVGGYISQQLFALRLPLLLIIVSIAALVGVSAGEEQKGLLETQLSLPVSRGKLLIQKMAAAWTVVLLASLGAVLGVAGGLLVIGHDYSLLKVLPDLLGCLLVALGYGMVGFSVAAFTGRRGLALGIASGLAFLSYLINSMAVSVSSLEVADKLTLFHYYQTGGGYHWASLGFLAAVVLLLAGCSLAGFTRRDVVK